MVKNQKNRMPIAVIFDHFGPYHWARLRGAAQYADIIGLELFGQTRDYAWERTTAPEASHGNLEVRTLLPSVHRTAASPSAIFRCVQDALEEYRPDAVAIPGWSDQGGLAALDWCARRDVPVILMSESQEHDEPRRWAKEAVKRRIVRLCSAALVGGTPHKEYLAALGMPRERIFLGYDVVDNDHFREGAETARDGGSALRTSLGLPERYFLASKRFIPKKNLLRVIEAFARYRAGAGAKAWDLVVMGNGPLEQEIQGATRALHLTDHVHLPGFKQYQETPSYYGLASAFIHASTTEQWGLVVNEAMAAGLPVVVSKRCGCAVDLVHHGVNGFVVDPEDVSDIAGAMASIAGHSDLASLGAASQRTIR
jgi:1,2-diacylglycerol 3-alpha-glucosyltransferase